jgi:hypothetical protein
LVARLRADEVDHFESLFALGHGLSFRISGNVGLRIVLLDRPRRQPEAADEAELAISRGIGLWASAARPPFAAPSVDTILLRREVSVRSLPG